MRRAKELSGSLSSPAGRPRHRLTAVLVLGAFGLSGPLRLAHAEVPAAPPAAVSTPAPVSAGPVPNPVAGPAPVPGDAAFDEQTRLAAELVRAERYQEALDAWNAAYNLRQRPELLLERARAHHRLGDSRDAIVLYRQYLAAAEGAPQALRTEAAEALRHLETLLQPPRPPAAPAQPVLAPGFWYPLSSPIMRSMATRIERRADNRLIAAGGVLLGSGYAAAFFTGIFVGIDRSRNLAGAMPLLVPIAGPYLSGVIFPAMRGSEYALYWSLPWMLVGGAAQIAGLILVILGHKHPRTRVTFAHDPVAGVRLAPFAGREGSGLVLSGSF